MSKSWRFDPDSFEGQPMDRTSMKRKRKEVKRVKREAERLDKERFDPMDTVDNGWAD